MKYPIQIKSVTDINDCSAQLVNAFACTQSEDGSKVTQTLLKVLALGDQEIARGEFRDVQVVFEALERPDL
jgi:hypothetical protein